MLGRVPGLVVLVFLLLFQLLFQQGLAADPIVQVVGLFKDKAVVKIDGKQRLLSAGQISPEGVTLISADSKQAVIDFNGERQTLTLSREVMSGFAKPEFKQVSIRKNNRSEYLVSGSINGRSNLFLVDTGASIVALNSQLAERLGIDYLKHGTKSQVVTAGGVRDSYNVVLDEVEVGGLVARKIAATIVIGPDPRRILLGMSYWQHVNMKESDGIMYLEQKY